MRRAALAMGMLLLGVSVLWGPSHRLFGVCAVLMGWGAVWVGSSRRTGDAEGVPRITHEWAIVLVLLAGALFLRVWRLGEHPPALWSDEAQHGLDARRISEQGFRPVFFPANCGQEPLYKYLAAGTLALTGHTVAGVRLPAALAGVSLVALAYLFGRRMGGPRLGTAAALLLSFSSWPLHFSRIAFRASLGPPLAVGSVLCILGRNDWRRSVASGALSGAILYTYPAFRIFPLVPLSWILFSPRSRAASVGRRWLAVAVWLVAFLVIASPFLLAARSEPSLALARTGMASLFSEAERPLDGLGRNAVRHLAMFTLEGDHNPRHNVPGAPMLEPVVGWLFLLGLALMIRKHPAVGWLSVAWMVTMLLPGVLSVERQAPHCLRSLGVIPIPYVLAGYALVVAGRRRAVRVFAVLALLLSGVSSAVRYWGEWPSSLASVDPRGRSLYAFNEDEALLARWLAGRSGTERLYLSPQLYLHPTVAYLAPPERVGYEILRHPAQVAHGGAVLCLAERNLWWLRNDSRKRFFDWWRSAELVSDAEVWEALVRSYPEPCGLSPATDHVSYRAIQTRFPQLSEYRFGPFVLLTALGDPSAPAPGSVEVPCASWVTPETCWTAWRRFPPGRFAVEADGDAPVAAEVREWCLDPSRIVTARAGSLVVDIAWPGDARFSVGAGPRELPEVRLRFLGPSRRSWEHPWIGGLRRLKAALLR